ncbi:MAG TPA: TetR/AcrR family transcriptional regulator [Oscillospiraceae bacterium]|nr:TetR/AcrR family transcriptional regulator [Oscillospiraceae bacterium]
MPKTTFFNLNKEKQSKIFQAAVQEFSLCSFKEASINQIIKQAGISRGSFYQYFRDKKDIYLYMLTEIGKEKLAVIDQARQQQPDDDFFAALLHITEAALTWAHAMPQYNQIGMRMILDESEFIIKLRELSPQAVAQLTSLIARDQQRGVIKSEVKPELIIEMITALMLYCLKEYYQSADYEGMLKQATEIYAIIKHGIAST